MEGETTHLLVNSSSQHVQYSYQSEQQNHQNGQQNYQNGQQNYQNGQQNYQNGQQNQHNMEPHYEDIQQNQNCCCSKLCVVLKFLIVILHVLIISLLIDLPWKAAAFFSIDKKMFKPKCLATCLQWIYGVLKFIFVIVAVFTLGIVSFRRDYLDVYNNNSSSARSIQLPPEKAFVSLTLNSPLDYNGTVLVKKNFTDDVIAEIALNNSIYEPSLKLFGDVIILDAITIALLVWVSLSKLSKRSKTRNRQALQMVEAGIEQRKDKDWDHPLIQLIDEINNMQTENNESTSTICTSIIVTLIPIGYIVYSILVSVMYLFVYFKHTQVMWPADWEITGCLKITVIIILLVGTTAIDLVYIQIVMGYVLRCQLNIYFLQSIINKVENDVDHDEAYIDQGEAIKDIKRAQKFLKQLNKDSKIVQLAIISAVIQAINCVIDLSNNMIDSDENPKPTLKEVALVCRFLGWMFLIMAPFYQASRANETIETLYDCDVVMHKSPKMFRGNTNTDKELVRMNVSTITLDAKLFNVPIHPGFIHLAIMVILLIFAVKSGFHLFENMLLL